MRKIIFITLVTFFYTGYSYAQIDLSHIDIGNILGKVLDVKKGFAPKFYLGNQPIEKIFKVAEIIGLKKNEKANKLFNTFKTGRTVYKIASYAGTAISLYGSIKALDKSAVKKDYQTALFSGLSTIGTGLIVKFLTKGASYKAVDIFNGIVRKTIKDILSVRPASSTLGAGLYVKL